MAGFAPRERLAASPIGLPFARPFATLAGVHAIGAQLTFEPLAPPATWLAILAALAAVAWEWARWGFLRVPPERRGRRALHAILLAAPLFAALGWLLAASATWAMAAIGVLALAWALRSYRRTTTNLSALRKLPLLALRLAVVLLLLIAALRPVLVHRVREPVRPGLAILVDTSASMARQDAPRNYAEVAPAADGVPPAPTIPRLNSVEQAMFDQQDRLESLAERYALRVYGFSGGLAEQPVDRMRPTGTTTAIGDAVQEAMDRFLAVGLDAAGAIVISDGANNTAERADPLAQARQLASRGVALWTVGVGSETPAGVMALNVRNLQAPEEVEALDRMSVAAEIEAVGFAGRRVTVTCTFGDRVLGREELLLGSAVQAQTVRFSAVPTQPGFQRLTVSAEPTEPPARPLVGRPQESRLVHVRSRHVRVLYIEGRRRFENKFIAQALSRGDRIRVTRWILTTGQPLPVGTTGPEVLRGYHVILLGDVPVGAFTAEQEQAILEMVGQDGRGLAMLGGRESFSDGGWTESALAAALPVRMDGSGQLDGPVAVGPTPDGLEHPVMQIDPEGRHAEAWARLRPLDGASAIGSAKPAATVLARDAADRALIVAQPYGAGRTLAMGLDTTWQWALSPDDTAELHDRFWRQVILWLANPTPNAWVATDRTTYDARRLAAGTTGIEVSAGVEDEAGTPLPDVPVRVTLGRGDEPPAPVPVRTEGEIRTARLAALPAGEYTLRLEAQLSGKDLAAEHRFDVIERDLEASDVVANLPLLRSIGEATAGASGGYRPLAELDAVLEQFLTGRAMQYREELRVDRLVDRRRWPLLLVLLAVLIAEWALRKRAGLV